MIIDSDNTREMSTSKLILDVVVKNNMIELNFYRYLALDRVQ